MRLEKDGSTLELVPPRAFSGVLPNCFVKEYIHWYHCDSKTVEFRPVKDPWTFRNDNWSLSRHGSVWKLTRSGHSSLLYPWSKSAVQVSKILSPLEECLELYMLLSRDTRVLSVELPRLQLCFYLEQGESVIRSKQFLGMQIDPDQSIGTLIGFTTKLVLRDVEDAKSRKVIIPQGDVTHHEKRYGSSGWHVNASVIPGSAHRVQAYRIDKLLGQQKDNGKVESKLYLAYLHALTSYGHPDPFTCRTGTEQALEILASAAIRSTGCLSRTATKSLESLAALAPGRSFYPHQKRVMQKVEWSKHLSFLTQDSRFHKSVQRIFDAASAIEFLHPTETIKPMKLGRANTCMHLVERDHTACRSVRVRLRCRRLYYQA